MARLISSLPLRLFIAFAAAAGLGAMAAGARPAAAPPPPLYAQQCASCHGAALEGGSGPALRSSLIAAEKPGDVYKIIKSGMPLTAPGLLSDAQAKLLADYIVAQNKQ